MPNPNSLIIPQELLILGAAVKTGLIDTLKKKPMTSTELSGYLQADSRATWIILEALLALGYLAKENEIYRLSKDADRLLFDKSAPDYMGYSFMHRFNLVERWVYLPDIIKTGQPAPRSTDPNDIFYFIEAMRYNARSSASAIAEFLLSGEDHKISILDIGGGPLIHASEFAKRGADTTVFDMPDVNALYQKEAFQYGIKQIAGDFTQILPEKTYDLAYLGNICHIINEKENQDLFHRVEKILKPKGRIAIADFIRGTNPGAALFAVNMLVNTPTGGTWTLKQYTDWLNSAGFNHVQLTQIAERQVITANKKAD